jgi:hypothetical protein
VSPLADVRDSGIGLQPPSTKDHFHKALVRIEDHCRSILAAACSELAVRRREVGLHSALGKEELGGDFPVRVPIDGQPQHLTLSVRERETVHAVL